MIYCIYIYIHIYIYILLKLNTRIIMRYVNNVCVNQDDVNYCGCDLNTTIQHESMYDSAPTRLAISTYLKHMGVEPKIEGKTPKMDGENNGKPY